MGLCSRAAERSGVRSHQKPLYKGGVKAGWAAVRVQMRGRWGRSVKFNVHSSQLVRNYIQHFFFFFNFCTGISFLSFIHEFAVCFTRGFPKFTQLCSKSFYNSTVHLVTNHKVMFFFSFSKNSVLHINITEWITIWYMQEYLQMFLDIIQKHRVLPLLPHLLQTFANLLFRILNPCCLKSGV